MGNNKKQEEEQRDLTETPKQSKSKSSPTSTSRSNKRQSTSTASDRSASDGHDDKENSELPLKNPRVMIPPTPTYRIPKLVMPPQGPLVQEHVEEVVEEDMRPERQDDLVIAPTAPANGLEAYTIAINNLTDEIRINNKLIVESSKPKTPQPFHQAEELMNRLNSMSSAIDSFVGGINEYSVQLTKWTECTSIANRSVHEARETIAESTNTWKQGVDKLDLSTVATLVNDIKPLSLSMHNVLGYFQGISAPKGILHIAQRETSQSPKANQAKRTANNSDNNFCQLCGKANHHTSQCKKFPSFDSRKAQAIEKNICTRCAVRYHPTQKGDLHEDCPQKDIVCSECIKHRVPNSMSNHCPTFCFMKPPIEKKSSGAANDIANMQSSGQPRTNPPHFFYN